MAHEEDFANASSDEERCFTCNFEEHTEWLVERAFTFATASLDSILAEATPSVEYGRFSKEELTLIVKEHTLCTAVHGLKVLLSPSPSHSELEIPSLCSGCSHPNIGLSSKNINLEVHKRITKHHFAKPQKTTVKTSKSPFPHISLERREWAIEMLIELSKLYPSFYQHLQNPIKKLTSEEKGKVILEASKFAGPVVEDLLALIEEIKKRNLKIVYMNATYSGGGVAEMFQSGLPFLLSLGLNIQWHILWASDPSFFTTTKRVHNSIQGVHDLEPNWEMYWKIHEQNRKLFAELKKDPNTIWFYDDPQPAGEDITSKDVCVLHIDTSGTLQEQGFGLESWRKLFACWSKGKVFLHQLGHGGPEDAGWKVPSLGLQPGINVLSLKNRPRNSVEEAIQNIKNSGVQDDIGRTPMLDASTKWIFAGRADPAKGQHKGLLAFAEYLQKDPQSVMWFFIQFAHDDPEAYGQYLMLKMLIEGDATQRSTLQKRLQKTFSHQGKQDQFESVVQLLNSLRTAMSERNDGINLSERVQIFLNQSQLLGDFAKISSGHLILSLKEGYNVIVTEFALQDLPVIATDIPAFRDRIINGTQGGWLIEAPTKTKEWDNIPFLEGYLEKKQNVLKFIHEIVEKMTLIAENPDNSKEMVEPLKKWALEQGNILRYHADRLACVLATKEDMDGCELASQVRTKVVKNLKHTKESPSYAH